MRISLLKIGMSLCILSLLVGGLSCAKKMNQIDPGITCEQCLSYLQQCINKGEVLKSGLEDCLSDR